MTHAVPTRRSSDLTRRMLEKHGLVVTHAPSVEDALALLDQAVHDGRAPGWDVVLTDVYLKGELSGKDLLLKLRRDYRYAKGQLPVLVMTGAAHPRSGERRVGKRGVRTVKTPW